jgi:glutathione synthase/RimK-type ligase-like ATP-grasp enzyme
VPLGKAVAKSGARLINDYPQMLWCMDKATMHLEFLTNGLNVPHSIILSPYDHEPEIKIKDLARLGRPFIIKPCLGGGGTGVVVGAETLADVLSARKTRNDQKFLLQEKIEPKLLDDRRAWFRVYWVLGKTFIVWWNDLTHLYGALAAAEEENYGLAAMREIIAKIAAISKLDFFSAEIALTTDNRFVVVDYVNDIVDMRLQSIHPDGVPDSLVRAITDAIIGFVAENNTGRLKKREDHAY